MADRVSYYSVLERTNKRDGDLTEWILWFLECMSRAIHSSNDLLANVMRKSRFWQIYAQTELNDRQCKVINRLLEAGPDGFEGGMTNRKYASMTHVSRATAQRELADLVEKKVFLANPGGGRSTSYRLIWESLEQ
jgi:Fic family protein